MSKTPRAARRAGFRPAHVRGRLEKSSYLFAAALLCLAAVTASAAEAVKDSALPLVPWPKSLGSAGVPPATGGRDGRAPADGTLVLGSASRIVYQEAALAPLAEVLRGEIRMSTAVDLKTARGTAGAGDIELTRDPQLQGEAYALAVSDRAVVRGGNYRAVAWGTVTLLQALAPAGGGKLRLPKMTVADAPASAYRGVLIDVARQWHPVETMRPLVDLCRLYKINYMQLHLNDQQSTVFPFKAFPELASATKGQRRTWTREEVLALVKYADDRGVTLVPEIEGPGHHAGNLRSLWGRKGSSCLDMGNEKTYEGLETVVRELCEVFASSPYIHIGADECSLGGIGESEEEKAFMAQHGLQGRGGLYNYYIVRMNEIIKKHGKQTICWEGFHGDGGGGAKIPKDVLVMPFESTYNPADRLTKLGYTVINTAWKPLYVVNNKKWPAQYIYENWNVRLWEHHVNTKCHIQLPPTAPVLGAQMCAWEQPADRELPSLRVRLHAMSERIWNPVAGKTYADFAARAAKSDQLLDRVLGFVAVETEGLSGKQYRGFAYFWDPITVRLSAVPVGTIHYTIDGKEPTPQSPKYTAPIRLSKSDTHSEKLFYDRRKGRFEATGDVLRVKARMFDAAGRPVGDVVTLRQYWHQDPAEQKAEEDEE
jgi:hexosaminidase